MASSCFRRGPRFAPIDASLLSLLEGGPLGGQHRCGPGQICPGTASGGTGPLPGALPGLGTGRAPEPWGPAWGSRLRQQGNSDTYWLCGHGVGAVGAAPGWGTPGCVDLEAAGICAQGSACPSGPCLSRGRQSFCFKSPPTGTGGGDCTPARAHAPSSPRFFLLGNQKDLETQVAASSRLDEKPRRKLKPWPLCVHDPGLFSTTPISVLTKDDIFTN